MIEIRSLTAEEIPAAKQLIYRVAHQVFHDTRTLEESIAYFEARSQLHDVEEFQNEYCNNGGTFLVMTDHNQIIATGALRRINDDICELKRLWLLFEYHGKKLGYRMMQELMSFARERGYTRMWLETDKDHQNRAYEFYKRMGFYEIPSYTDSEDDVAMEIIL